MPYEPITNFKDGDGVDLGKKLITKDYLLEVYGSLLDTLAPGITPTPGLWTWGNNGTGQLGINENTNIPRSTPVTTLVGGNNWKSIGCGTFHTGAIKTDGSLWVWGRNDSGQLGVNDITTRNTPVTTLLGGNNWKSVAGGLFHTIAIKTDGSLWGWGANSRGQLGINDIAVRTTPVTTLLGGNNWKSIACSGYSTAAIKTDGSLWTWGENGDGQLGVNDTTNRNTPVTTLLGGNNWKSIDYGDAHTIAIKTDGSLWVWGQNSFAQLGVNDTNARTTPVTTLLGGNNWKSVSGGVRATAAIKTDGSLWTWGDNSYGRLGINDNGFNGRTTPVTTLLGGNNWKSVVAGGFHIIAIKTDGTLWNWGRNNNGELGFNNDSLGGVGTPLTTLLGGNNWKSISAGDGHTFAIQSVDYI